MVTYDSEIIYEMNEKEIRSHLSLIKGKGAWGVSHSIGSIFWIDFGRATKPKKLLLAPTVWKSVGEYTLFINCCDWAILLDDEPILRWDEYSGLDLERRLLVFEGREFLDVIVSIKKGLALFKFDGGISLVCGPNDYYKNESEMWWFTFPSAPSADIIRDRTISFGHGWCRKEPSGAIPPGQFAEELSPEEVLRTRRLGDVPSAPLEIPEGPRPELPERLP